MDSRQTILVLGGTGRTGGRVLQQALDRGTRVRAVVRSAERLPAGVAGHPDLEVVEADLTSLDDTDLVRLVGGCDAVVSCLGHRTNLSGILGPPRDLVAGTVRRVCRAVREARGARTAKVVAEAWAGADAEPARPVRLILMSSVSVNRRDGRVERRSAAEKMTLWLLRGLLPPARDNQRAVDYLARDVGTENSYVEWVAVRPDTLRDGDVTEYGVHDDLVNGLFRPGETNMANVAHFMCELATDPQVWSRWRGGLPVIVNR